MSLPRRGRRARRASRTAPPGGATAPRRVAFEHATAGPRCRPSPARRSRPDREHARARSRGIPSRARDRRASSRAAPGRCPDGRCALRSLVGEARSASQVSTAVATGVGPFVAAEAMSEKHGRRRVPGPLVVLERAARPPPRRTTTGAGSGPARRRGRARRVPAGRSSPSASKTQIARVASATISSDECLPSRKRGHARSISARSWNRSLPASCASAATSSRSSSAPWSSIVHFRTVPSSQSSSSRRGSAAGRRSTARPRRFAAAGASWRFQARTPASPRLRPASSASRSVARSAGASSDPKLVRALEVVADELRRRASPSRSSRSARRSWSSARTFFGVRAVRRVLDETVPEAVVRHSTSPGRTRGASARRDGARPSGRPPARAAR